MTDIIKYLATFVTALIGAWGAVWLQRAKNQGNNESIYANSTEKLLDDVTELTEKVRSKSDEIIDLKAQISKQSSLIEELKKTVLKQSESISKLTRQLKKIEQKEDLINGND